MPRKLPTAAPPGRLIGYARVSTEEQGTDLPLDDLCATGRPRKEQTTQKRATEAVAALVAGRSTITLVQLGTELTRLGLAQCAVGTDRARAAGLLAPTWRQPLRASGARHPPAPSRPRR